MSGTITEKVLGSPSNSFVDVGVDLLMGHDGTASLIIDRFYQDGGLIWDTSKILIVFDHFAPPATVERANIQNKLFEFVINEKIPLKLYEGIAHQLLLEDPKVGPGTIVIGADSHTTTVGATGALATGIGATDFLNVLTSGEIWLKVPESIKVILTGKLPIYIQGKDIILALLGQLGPDGANYRCLEFHDLTDDGISMDSRATICNMAVDLGAKFGLFSPDDITKEYIKKRGGNWQDITPDSDARYQKEIVMQVDELSPLLLDPKGQVVSVEKVEGTKVTQIFLGSCTSGRLEDFVAMDKIYKQHSLSSYIKTIVIPASQKIFRTAIDFGYIQTCMDAGAVVLNSSCGPCCNIDKGLIGDGEICVSTSNRNYAGRMGSLKSHVYLASTLTAAATSVMGKIADPRRFLS